MKNLTGSSVQARETIYYWTDSNGTTGQFSQTETDTLSANGGTGWSHQYRDRASFQAKGEIYYAGAWRTAYTVRSVAWSQDAMPNGSGGTRDVSGDVTYILNAFTGVSAPSPNFYPEDRLLALLTFSSADLSANGWVAVTYRTGSPIYTSVQIVLSTASSWGSQNNTRAALCHEMDHAVGLNHVWYHNSAGIEVVGSKATCIGTSIPAGPSIDDVSALNAVYTNPAP